MITHACVAIHLLGAPATPEALQALQQRCDGILGAGECRLIGDSAPEGTNAASDGGNACWRATIARAADDAAASVVVSAPGAPAAHIAQRDLTFQSRDERTDRWATLGLVIAALVTLEEHSADTNTTPAAAAPTVPAPAASPAPAWFSRDPSPHASATIAAGSEGPPRTPPRIADMRVLAIGDVGRLPWATLGVRLAATLEILRYLDVEIGGAYLMSTGAASLATASGGGGGANFDLWSATLGLCPRSLVSLRLTGHVCAGGDVTAMTGRGFGFAEVSQATAWVNQVWFGFDSELHLSRHLALVAEYKTELALTRPTFTVAGTPTVFQPARVSVNLGLGVAAVF